MGRIKEVMRHNQIKAIARQCWSASIKNREHPYIEQIEQVIYHLLLYRSHISRFLFLHYFEIFNNQIHFVSHFIVVPGTAFMGSEVSITMSLIIGIQIY